MGLAASALTKGVIYMRQYELTVLIHPDLEMNLEPATDKIAKLIESVGGKITKVNNEGKKRLSYKVAKQDYAVYFSYDLELPAGDAAERITKVLGITDEVLRYLLVTADERKAKMEAKRSARTPKEGEPTEEE